jgi:hypothetical protein
MVLGMNLCRYMIDRQPITWSDSPILLLQWVFFAVCNFGLWELRKRRREKRQSA